MQRSKRLPSTIPPLPRRGGPAPAREALRASWCLVVALLATACASVERGTVAVDGSHLYYEAHGEGPTLILLEGAQLDLRMWDEQFAAFAEHCRVVRFDVRGFGRSGAADRPYRSHDDLIALMDALGIARAHLVGLSLGGRIAIDAAITHPERVGALVLAGPGISGWEWSADDFAAITEARRDGRAQLAAERWLEHPYMAPAMEQTAIRARVRELALANARVWVETDAEEELAPPALERLAELRAPTLVLLGERDVPDIHAISRRIAAEAPSATMIELPDVGHLLNIEAPDAFTRHVLDFFLSDADSRVHPVTSAAAP